MSPHTALDVAKWMRGEVHRTKRLDQDAAVAEIKQRFGSYFVYENENGNPAISEHVLREFREITKSRIVWIKTGRYWRPREPGDRGSRQQDF